MRNDPMTLGREKLSKAPLRNRDLFFQTLSLSDTHNDLGKHSRGTGEKTANSVN